MLTGHTKEKFVKWYKSQLVTACKEGCMVELNFESMPLSMQTGVIEDFAESLGYLIWHRKRLGIFDDIWYIVEIEKDGIVLFNDHFKTKKESRNDVINQLNILINKVK